MLVIDDGCRFGHHFLMAGERFVDNKSSHRIKFITWLFYGMRLNPAMLLDGHLCVGLGQSIEYTTWEGQMAHHGDDVCRGLSVFGGILVLFLL